MDSHATIRQTLEARQQALASRLSKIRVHTHREAGPLNAKPAEQAVELENEEVLTSLGSNAREEVLKIRAALERIDAGKYGRCVGCNAKIAPRRLEAMPFALHCMKCAERSGMS